MTTAKTAKTTKTTKKESNATLPVGLEEISVRLDVARTTVDKWRQRELLPDPTWTVGGRPAWNWPVVRRWARDTGRLS